MDPPSAIPNFREIMGFEATEVTYEDDTHNSTPDIQRNAKKSLPIWGNATTMNMNNLILENIVQSAYYKNYLVEVLTFQQATDEVYHNVKHLEPWERGTKKTPGSGMCGSVRGVGTGGIISSCFCLLYKFFTLRITRKQLVSMINSTQSVYMRGMGFLYIRFTQPPTDLLAWMEPYLDDADEIDPRAGGGETQTIGQLVRQMLTKLDWYGTLFPRLPFSVQKEIESKFGDKSRFRDKAPERKRVKSPVRSGQSSTSVSRRKRCSHHLRHHHCRKHRKNCPKKAKKAKLARSSEKKSTASGDV